MTDSAWLRFWNRGVWWRAVLVVALYLALYLGAGQLVGRLFGDRVDPGNLFGSPGSVFFGLTAPLVIGSVILAAFVLALGWVGPLFSPQPVRRVVDVDPAGDCRGRDCAAAARHRLRRVLRGGCGAVVIHRPVHQVLRRGPHPRHRRQDAAGRREV